MSDVGCRTAHCIVIDMGGLSHRIAVETWSNVVRRLRGIRGGKLYHYEPATLVCELQGRINLVVEDGVVRNSFLWGGNSFAIQRIPEDNG